MDLYAVLIENLLPARIKAQPISRMRNEASDNRNRIWAVLTPTVIKVANI